MLLLGVVIAVVVGTAGAYFTGQVQVPENVIRAGSVAMSAEPTSAALSIDALAPGATRTRYLTVLNDGSLPVSVVVTGAKKAGYTAFYEALSCRVTWDAQVLYEGPMSAMRTSPVRLAPGSRARLTVAVSLPETAGNDLMGDYVKLTLYANAEQVL